MYQKKALKLRKGLQTTKNKRYKSKKRTQPITQQVIQRAIADPTQLTPDMVRTLQTTHGNRFVCRLMAQRTSLGQLGTNPLGNMVNRSVQIDNRPYGAQPTIQIQRKINIQFRGHVGARAQLTSPHNKAYKKIKSLFNSYTKTEDGAYIEQKRLLKRLKGLSENYLHLYSDKNRVKSEDVQNLLEAIKRELPTVWNNAIEANSERYARFAQQTFTERHNKIDWSDIREGEIKGSLPSQFDLLSWPERRAIRAYTDYYFKQINPATADSADWMRGTTKINDGTLLDESMRNYKKLGKLVQAGLNKLPDWEQDQDLYRGETFPISEGRRLTAGTTKYYPNFVSTSLIREVPESFLNTGIVDQQRPYRVLFKIKKSKHGKDISSISKHDHEKEILFPARTLFRITESAEPVDKTKVDREVTLEER